eukprot:CAMPEP_0197174672 /NCGR_PEP_ID=MMETSP1423-20130617/1083_1 /TAXON_ID=476441 /ORGANISM="Pseudo-nitzschia heimii, Strain UNC1101" /LENGTH=204 /DNA_ID=CAMNT_0042623615 /DNA_START=82 /DNA_END=696 /DNA_ORIENTATION=+
MIVSCFEAAEIESSWHPRMQMLRNNREKVLQGQDKKESHMARKAQEAESSGTHQVYEVGTPVSVKRVDGSWTNGEITKVDENGYTIKWEQGNTYIIGPQDGELHQMVKNSATQADIPEEEDIGYIPSEVMETTDSRSWTIESTILVLFLVAILAVVAYVRRKKFVAISSKRKADGGIWGANQNGTTLSLQMDEHRNLRNSLSMM